MNDIKDDLNVLVVENDPKEASRLEKALKDLGYDSHCVLDLEDLAKGKLDTKPDLAILGPGLQEEGSSQGIHALKIQDAYLPILCSTPDAWVSGGSAGSPSFDGIFWIDPTLGALSGCIDEAVRYRSTCELSADYPLLVGGSRAIRVIRKKIQQLAKRDITILITGESGTGKELIARSIHCHSDRSKGPLVKVNCGALPDDLLESEVFGFQRGAFTGAHKNKPGRFELADGGTLFVDEIGDLSYPLQAKFLQVLEEKAFSRLGDTDEKTVDVRVVTATNSNLLKKVQEGAFRKDLFYRLNVAHIHAPALRERPDDVPVLARYFLARYSEMLKKDIMDIPERVISFLQVYHWPGNVREIENVVRRAIVMKDWGFVFEDLKPEPFPHSGESASSKAPDGERIDQVQATLKKRLNEGDFSLKSATKAYVAEVEREAILKALEETRWNRKKAAQNLKVSYRTLISRIEDLDLKA